VRERGKGVRWGCGRGQCTRTGIRTDAERDAEKEGRRNAVAWTATLG